MFGYYNAQTVIDYIALNPSLPTLKRRRGDKLKQS